MNFRKRTLTIIITAILLISIVSVIPVSVLGGTESSGTGTFQIANQAPSVTSFHWEDTTGNTVTGEIGFTPNTEYWLIIDVSDSNSIDDIVEIKVQFFYDTSNAAVGTPPTSVSKQQYVILKYTRSAGTGTAGVWKFYDESDNELGTTYGSWSITDKEDPTDWTLTSGTFKVKIKIGKVAHEANTGNSDDWDCIITAKDSQGDTGSNQAYGYKINWYGEITVIDTSFDFGTVNLDSENNQLSTPADKNVDLKVVANGNYNINVKASDSTGSNDYWVGDTYGKHATIVKNNPDSGQIRLKVDSDGTPNSNDEVVINPQSLDYNSWLTGQSGPTNDDEDGGQVHQAYLYLDVGPGGLLKDTYRGKVYFQVENG